MNDLYAQAAMSYVHRVRSWARIGYLIAGGILAFAVLVLAFLNATEGGYLFPVFLLIFDCGLFFLLAVHVRDQFSQPQARLIPNYHRAHAVVAAAAALIVAVLLPTIFTLLAGWRSVGFVAVTICLSGTILWRLLPESAGWIIWPELIAWLMLLTKPGRELLQQLVSGEFECQAVGLLAAGAVAILLGGIRLVRLNGDTQEYSGFKWNRASGTVEYIAPRVAQDSIRQGLVFRVEEKLMARLTRHAQRASASRWSRVCRWQVGMLTGWPVIGFGLMFFLSFSFVTWIMSKGTPPLIALSAFFASVMPASLVWGTLRRRRKVLPRESLMCVDRATYLKQVGMAAALNQLQVWLSMTAMFVLWRCWVVQQPLSVAVAYVLAFSALSQPWFFGLNVWLLRFRSLIPVFLGWMVFFPVFAGATIGIELGPASPEWPIVLLVAAIFAVLGLILTWDAYRRWLATDFD